MNAFFLAYLFFFGTAAAACLAGAYRARSMSDPDTRSGLVVLLVMSAGWAATYFGMFVASPPGLERGFYLVGLVLGTATVGAWLWFCSAYSNRTLHRDASLQRGAILVFVVIVGTKLTNPWHGLYYSVEPAQVPFSHLKLHYHALYWGLLGLSYVLAAVGYFMLFELFRAVGSSGGKLGLLAGLTALPLLFNGLGTAVPWLLNISHEPLGVAAFAIGVSFLYQDQFQAVQVAGKHEAPVIVLTAAQTVLDYNRRATALFPDAFEDQQAVGRPLDQVFPEAADALATGAPLMRLQRTDGTRYYQLGVSTVAIQGTRPCRLLLLTDVTERHRMQERLLEVQEEERRRIEQEIHDEVGGLLASLQLTVDLARTQLNGQTVSPDPFDDIEDLVSSLSTTARMISRKLYPASLTEHGLLGAVSSLINDLEQEHGLAADLDTTLAPDARFPSLVERTAYWVVQEALLNVALHADTDTAHVEIIRKDNHLSLRIRDDGVGFVPEETNGNHSFGLEGLRRRVERLDGSVTITSALDEGTDLSARLPTTPPLL